MKLVSYWSLVCYVNLYMYTGYHCTELCIKAALCNETLATHQISRMPYNYFSQPCIKVVIVSILKLLQGCYKVVIRLCTTMFLFFFTSIKLKTFVLLLQFNTVLLVLCNHFMQTNMLVIHRIFCCIVIRSLCMQNTHNSWLTLTNDKYTYCM